MQTLFYDQHKHPEAPTIQPNKRFLFYKYRGTYPHYFSVKLSITKENSLS